MKSNELRIGNLVRYDNRTFEIDTIANEFPTLKTIEFGIGVVDWRSLEPIPLTEEWLLKLGFKFRSERLCTIGYFEIHILEGVYFVKSYYLRKTQYVHQLQNLYFALTGEELTIKD